MTPFDVYELNLFQLVATGGSFTKAAQQAGLTQSAVTRQIRGMEDRLGVQLLERTTRVVRLTSAGKLLFARSQKILDDVSDTFRQLQQDFHLVPEFIRVGVSRSIGLAYLPAFFFAFQKKFPAVQVQIEHHASAEILTRIEGGELDAGILSPPPQLVRGLRITHRFDDEFTIIVPPRSNLPAAFKEANEANSLKILARERWLSIDRESNTGKRLHHWLGRQGVPVQPAIEVDTFDLIVNLVSMGMGVSMVPHRVLPLYVKSRPFQRINLSPRFSREVVVVVRKNRKQPERLTQFVDNILF